MSENSPQGLPEVSIERTLEGIVGMTKRTIDRSVCSPTAEGLFGAVRFPLSSTGGELVVSVTYDKPGEMVRVISASHDERDGSTRVTYTVETGVLGVQAGPQAPELLTREDGEKYENALGLLNSIVGVVHDFYPDSVQERHRQE